MNLHHFQALSPVCPLCRVQRQQSPPLIISQALRQKGDLLLEGILQCTNSPCLMEFPIIDGIPVLVPNPQAYLSNYLLHIVARDDLSIELQNMLGESCGPGSPLDATRTHLSSYAWDHYSEFDPSAKPASSNDPQPGSVARVLQQGLDLIPNQNTLPSPVLDAGCSVGRTTFELAQRCEGLVLGVDLNFSMLRLATHVLRDKEACYPSRSVGLIYQQCRFPVQFRNTDRVDFWAADATALPFQSQTFATAVSLNLLDCMPSPLDLLRSMRDTLKPGGRLLLTCPYDWSGSVTAPQAWVGGHSPRSSHQGDSAAVLRALLTPAAHPVSVEGLRLTAELTHVPWHVRMHDRSFTSYQAHMVVATRT